MSYRLNKTNGELIVELADGQIDNTSTDITLVGRNYRGFGELFNENFIKIVENFASTGAPDAPLQGQLWYDTNQQRLKIYNGTEFRTAGSPIVSSSRPSLIQGDLWIDNVNRKLYFYDGNEENEITLVGPAYDEPQGKTGLEVVSVIDTTARERVIIQLFIADELFAVITNAEEEFFLSGTNKIQGYPDNPDDTNVPATQRFRQGFNLVNNNSLYRGTAESASSLIDDEGNERTPADFLNANQNEETTGSLFIKNSNGITIGVNDTAFATLKILGNTTAIENQQSATDIVLRTKLGNQFKNAVYVKGQNERVGIHNSDPQFSLDLTGDLRTTGDAIIEGDLTVKGNASYFNVQTLQVLDKNIELGLLDDSTEGDDDTIDGGGITLRSLDGSKDLFWDKSLDSWNSNVNFNLSQGNSYKINGQNVLSLTELGPLVKSANGLTSIGKLDILKVDDLEIDTNIISAPSVAGIDKNIVLNPSKDVSVSNSKIIDVSEPTNNQDAATKNYVDTQILITENISLALDITGLDDPVISDPRNDVGVILESIAPASEKQNGTIARIHGTAYNNTSISGIDVSSAANISRISVLTDDSTAESVIQDISFDPVSGNFSPIPTRLTFTFEVQNGAWNHQSTV